MNLFKKIHKSTQTTPNSIRSRSPYKKKHRKTSLIKTQNQSQNECCNIILVMNSQLEQKDENKEENKENNLLKENFKKLLEKVDNLEKSVSELLFDSISKPFQGDSIPSSLLYNENIQLNDAQNYWKTNEKIEINVDVTDDKQIEKGFNNLVAKVNQLESILRTL